MQTERPFISTHHPDVLGTRSKDELYQDVLDAKHNGIELILVDYLEALIHACGLQLVVEAGEKPDPDKQMILALNHHSRRQYVTTEESLLAVATASVGARDSGLSDSHIAWMIRDLDIPLIGIGKKARKVQNATAPVFGSIAAKTTKKLEWRGIIPSFRDVMEREEIMRVSVEVAKNVQAGNIIGSFPEQKPSKSLLPFHRNFPRVLSGVLSINPNSQVPTLGIFYENNVVRAHFGPIINIDEQTDVKEAAHKVMLGIGKVLPRRLHGHYAKSLQLQ